MSALSVLPKALRARDVDAIRVIPKLSKHNLVPLAWYVVPVVAIAVLLLIVGASFWIGWLY